MIKSVMLSIKPKYCELIASGRKTIEVRKTRPKIDTPFKCYIYQSKTVYVSKNKTNEFLKPIQDKRFGKVIAEFVCDDIKPLRYDALEQSYILRTVLGFDLNEEFLEGTCLSYNEIFDYCKNLTYDNSHTDMFYGWHISDLVIYDAPKKLSEFWHCGVKLGAQVSRPPQSWCYVEERIKRSTVN